jgi:hypothetical protein
MALNVGIQRQILLERARDPFGTANAAAMIWDLFNRLQQAVNAQIEDVVGEATIGLNQRQCVYQVSNILPTSLKILGVRDSNKDLYPMKFEQLRGLDRYWFRRFHDYLKWFCLCGYDLLLIGPPQDSLQEATTVDVRYTALTSPILSDANVFQLQDENVQSVMLLSEAILLAKARDWPGAQVALQRAVRQLGLEKIALRDMPTDVAPTTEVAE